MTKTEKESLIVFSSVFAVLVIVTAIAVYATEAEWFGLQSTTSASTIVEDKPNVPDNAREVCPNTWYWETGGQGKAFVQRSQKATVIQRDVYADNGWHYLHLVLEADGRRIAISWVKRIPFVDPDTSVGDKVKMSYIGSYIMFVGRVTPDEL